MVPILLFPAGLATPAPDPSRLVAAARAQAGPRWTQAGSDGTSASVCPGMSRAKAPASQAQTSSSRQRMLKP